ncbi:MULTISPECIES: DUF982 domain-containing protein [Hyphomicrobiales]|uniref:DUF982 domain-containing protein n=1 Tax=Hyphomicrobiales TaxID=356 RepID=UPI0002FD2156|nr:DUF982 domain-containing protein [Agrobacterium pusense]WKD47933.1 DUF982 domain-containing protein [Agrobacterium pusense]
MTVQLPSNGTQVVASAHEAAECLMELWAPKDVSDEYDEALRVCLAVYEGELPPEAARAAFVAAAAAASLPHDQ